MRQFDLKPLARPFFSRRSWLGMLAAAAPGLVFANPTGGEVVAGGATISTPDLNGVQIDQSTQATVINWQSFSIAGNEYVVFNQPSASAIALNRVVGGDPSQIFGSLLANGRVFLVNPSGVLFAPGAQVDVGGLVATTMDISDADFMNGRYVFSGGGEGQVVNEGNISAGEHGFVVLAGDYVSNSGVIQAQMGQVVLASGSAMTLDLSGDGLVNFSVDEAAVSNLAGVENFGQIIADGGTVVMTAEVARSLVGTVVNNEGLVRAQSIENGPGGAILLSGNGGNVVNSGTLDASAGDGNADGGYVAVRSDSDITLSQGSRIDVHGGDSAEAGSVRVVGDGDVDFQRGAVIDARAGQGGGFVELSGHRSLRIRGQLDMNDGALLIDPTNVTIAQGFGSSSSQFNSSTSGSYTSATVYEQFIEGQLRNGNNVTVAATNNLTVADLSAQGGDGALDGRCLSSGSNCIVGAGGNLLLGIGTVVSSSGSYAGPLPYGIGAGDPPQVVFTRGSGDPGSPGGLPTGIFFTNLSNGIRVDGDLSLVGGSARGPVKVGDLEAGGDLGVDGFDGVSVGNAQAGGLIRIESAAGAVGIGAATAGGTVTLTGPGGVLLNGGAILSNGGSVVINGNVSAQGGVDISAASDVLITGNVNAGNLFGSNIIGGGDVLLTAVNGDISVGDITALRSSDVAFGDVEQILLNAAGNVTTGALSATHESYGAQIIINAGSINVGGPVLVNANAGFAGDLNFGASGNIIVTGPIGGTELANVDLNAGGKIVTGDIAVAVSGAPATVQLTADGYIIAGNLSASGSSSASIFLTGSDVNAATGRVIEAGNLSVSANAAQGTSAQARVNVSGSGSGDIVLGDIDVSATGSTATRNANAQLRLQSYGGGLSAGDITVSGNAPTSSGFAIADASLYAVGDINAGDITATASTIGQGYAAANVNAYAPSGSVSLGDVSATATSFQGGYRSGAIGINANTGIQTGNLLADGSISLYSSNASSAGTGINTGNIDALGYLSVTAFGAPVALGDVNVGDPGVGGEFGNQTYVTITGGSGVSTGAITVTNDDNRASLYVNTQSGDITINGDLTVTGGGGSAGSYGGFYSTMAEASLSAYSGQVHVTGDVTLNADPFLSSFGPTDGSSGSSGYQQRGDAYLFIGADQITLDGDLDITGYGTVNAFLSGNSGVTISGTTVVTANSAVEESTSSGGLVRTTLSGQAQFSVSAGNSFNDSSALVDLGPVRVTGPSAFVDIFGGQVVLGSTTSNNDALIVTATPDSALFSVSSGDTPLLQTNFGFAGANITGVGSVLSTGNLSVTGPAAGLQIASRGDIDVFGDIDVQGTGFYVDGDWSLLPFFSDSFGSFGLRNAVPVRLDQGRIEWGGADLTIGGIGGFSSCSECQPSNFTAASVSGPFFDVGAGQVTLGGDVNVSGQGEASINIRAAGVSVGSAAAGNGALSAIATAGYVQGSYSEFEFINGSSYSATRVISDGASGAARYGHARIDISGTGSSSAAFSFGSLYTQGLSASIDLSGSGDWTVRGDISVLGSTDTAPIYVEDVSYTPLGSGSSASAPLPDSHTEITGNINAFSLGFNSSSSGAPQPNSLTAGNITVTGTGVAAVVVNAGSISVGDVTIDAAPGYAMTNDPASSEGFVDTPLGDAVLLLSASTGPAQTGSVSVSSATDTHLGGSIDASGSFTVNAGGLLDQTIPQLLLNFEHPFEQFDVIRGEISPPPGNAASFVGSSGGLALPPLNVSASDITIDFGAASTLSGVSLTAANGLHVGGPALNVDSVDWQAGSIDLATMLSAGEIRLNAGGDLSTGDLQASEDIVLIAGGAVQTGDLVSDSGSAVVRGASIDGGDITAASQIIVGGNVDSRFLGEEEVFFATGPAANVNLGNLSAASVQVGDYLLSQEGVISFSTATVSLGDVTATDFAVLRAYDSLTTGNLSVANGNLVLRGAGAITVNGDVSALGGDFNVLGAIRAIFGPNGEFLSQVVDNALDSLTINGDVVANTVALGLLDFEGDYYVQNVIVNGSVTATNDLLGAAQNSFTTGALVTSSGPIDIVAGNIDIDQLSTSGDVSLVADTGGLAVGGDINTEGDILLGAAGALNFGNLSAVNIDLAYGANSQFAGTTVTAGQALNLVSGNGVLSGSDFDWTAATMTLNGNLAGSGDGSFNGSSSLALTGSALNFNGDLALSGATLSVVDTLLASGGDATLSGGSISFADSALNAGGTGSLTTGGSFTGSDSSLSGAAGLSITAADITSNNVFFGAGGSGLAMTSTVGAISLSADPTTNLPSPGSVPVSLNAATDLTINGGSFSGGLTTLTAGGDIALFDTALAASSLSADAFGDLMLSDAVLNVGSASLTAGGDLSIDDSLLAGNVQTLTAGGALNLSGSSLTGSDGAASSIDLTAGTTLDVLNSDLGAGTLSLAGTGITLDNSLLAGDLAANASGALTVLHSALVDGADATLRGNSIDIADDSVLLYSDSLSLQSTGGAISIANSQIGGTNNQQTKDAGPNAVQQLSVSAAQALTILNSRLDGVEMSLQAGRAGNANLSLNGATILADRLSMTAAGSVLGSGAASTVDAGAIGVSATTLIDLRTVALAVGTGLAPFGTDAALVQLLPASLRPTSSGPNAAFAAPELRLGSLSLDGDYLYIRADAVSLPNSVSAPTNLLVNYTPFTSGASIGIENAAAALRDVNFNVADHFAPFPGTTYVFGGSNYDGDIFVGQNGAVTPASSASNVVFLTSGTRNVNGPDQVRTNGQVVVLGGVSNPTNPPPEPPPPSDNDDTEDMLGDFTPQFQEFTPDGDHQDIEEDREDGYFSDDGTEIAGGRSLVDNESSATLECQ